MSHSSGFVSSLDFCLFVVCYVVLCWIIFLFFLTQLDYNVRMEELTVSYNDLIKHSQFLEQEQMTMKVIYA